MGSLLSFGPSLDHPEDYDQNDHEHGSLKLVVEQPDRTR